MGIAGIGIAFSSLGSQYDFTKMTNQQLFDAANELGSEGKISKTDADQLSAFAQGIDYAAIDPQNAESPAQFLSDPTQHNFIQEAQNDELGAIAAGNVGGDADLYATLLKDLSAVQGTSTRTVKSSISVQA